MIAFILPLFAFACESRCEETDVDLLRSEYDFVRVEYYGLDSLPDPYEDAPDVEDGTLSIEADRVVMVLRLEDGTVVQAEYSIREEY